MRILHVGHDHVGRGVAETKSFAEGKRDHRFYGWQRLPLRDVYADRNRNSKGCLVSPSSGGSERDGPMRQASEQPVAFEPERYELRAAASYHFEVGRRDFFKFLGAGLVVASVLKPALATQESGGARQHRGDSLPQEINAWLHIGEDGKVTVYTGKGEVGKNIRTSLSQAVAEELSVPITKIEMVMGDTQLTPFDMGTFGSRTTPTMNLQLRKVAATAREMLIGLAAAQWQTDRQHLVAAEGKITDSQSNRSVEYAALTKGQQLSQTVTAETPLIPAGSWKVAGQSALKMDGRDFVT